MKKYLSALLLCGFALSTAIAADEGTLQISDMWVRALPPTQPNTAAYATIVNTGSSAVTLVGGRTEIAEAVEIHTTRELDGLSRMEQLTEVVAAPGETLTFAPGGMHLMLLGLERMPAAGEELELCLRLKNAEEVCANAAVLKRAGKTHSHEHH